ncbi:hypothetical protein Brsp07_05206 [Brucella sp. NBRC 14130]|nr:MULTISPECIES: hypothetical protein [Brucella/Ochrobactrum group]
MEAFRPFYEVSRLEAVSDKGSVANFSLLLRYCRFGAHNWAR